MKAIKVDIYGNVSEVKDTSLEGLKEAVGGWLEAVYLRMMPYKHEGRKYGIMLVDSDGLVVGKNYNRIGTTIYQENTRYYGDNIVVGDVVFTTDEVWN